MKNQKGVSLITVFLIMTIILSVVLSLSLLLLSELKNSSNTQDSIIAFYVADSGIEKFLYYNRRRIPSTPPGVVLGMCAMDTTCPDCAMKILPTGEDCMFCKKCEISYATDFDGKNSDVSARVVPNGSFYYVDVSSKGYYKDTSRAIGLQIINKDLSSSAPFIDPDPSKLFANRSGEVVNISADIIDPDQVDNDTVWAHIRNSVDPDIPDVDKVLLKPKEGFVNTYENSWSWPDGYYYVYVRACDKLGNCGESIRIPITNQ